MEDTPCSKFVHGGTRGSYATVVTKVDHDVLDIEDLKCYIQLSLAKSTEGVLNPHPVTQLIAKSTRLVDDGTPT